MPYLIVAAVLAAIMTSFQVGVRWQQGLDAQEREKAQKQIERLVKNADEKGIEHAEKVDQLNAQLLSTQNALTRLTDGRKCLSADAVRLLNRTSAADVSAAPSQPASAPEAFATDRDVGAALNLCRIEYDKLADQMNAVLDIEDNRQRKGWVRSDVREAPR